MIMIILLFWVIPFVFNLANVSVFPEYFTNKKQITINFCLGCLPVINIFNAFFFFMKIYNKTI